MASKGKTVNLAGLDLIVNRIVTGATAARKGNVSIADSIPAGAISNKLAVVSTTAATATLTEAQSGTVFYLNRAAGIVYTLPVLSAAMVGTYYDFVVGTVVTSNAYKWSTGTQGTEFFNGSFVGMDEDGTVTSGVIFTGDGATHDNISMNGTTTGGRFGTQFRIVCTSATTWTVQGLLGGNGTIATPFATT